ncbi:MAG TPA: fused MFS/spermidine synthase [Thermoanaerobaculaceae bacterium]|nr:fused MFS/spermidine synthase [Thermoanaerobaculaceae bacterium]HPS76665.1 fused MFS/spermidine synthase [Thermoanaerobaculaceae bacterium]
MEGVTSSRVAAGWLSVATVALMALAPGVAAQGSEIVRADRTSPYGRVRVTDYRSTGLRCLQFPPGRALQSCMKLDDPTSLVLPYSRAMAATLAVPQHLQRLLMVGLGGGSLVRWVRHYLPELQQDVVEIDPVVVQVARELFAVTPDDHVRLAVEDGRAFIVRAPSHYDLVWLDAYGPDSVPPHLTTVEFFQLVRAHLTPGGAVAANIWGPAVNPAYDSQVRAIQEVFPETYVLAEHLPGASGMALSPGLAVMADGSRIVVGSLAPRLGAEAWAAAAATLQVRRTLDLDLAALVRAQYHLISGEAVIALPPHDPPSR